MTSLTHQVGGGETGETKLGDKAAKPMTAVQDCVPTLCVEA